ncbi:hypothetical protein H0Z60_07045 [Ectothiorhodospiraceae bacterium WFHF3C12]|nr:hypothetical protein [Ectothiorhodospiraceae bacterium WFHF3C12]
MDLHKIGVKVYAEEREPLDLLELIPVFHRWIQTGAVDDLLIDVADYSHVHEGPGIMLIAHEGNYGYDEAGGRRGMLYYSKQPLEGDLEYRLGTVTAKSLKACSRLLQEKDISAGVGFPVSELEVFSNDRLAAPNTEEAFQALLPTLEAVAGKLFGAGGYTLERVDNDPRERLTVRITADEASSPELLLERLAA